MYNDEYKLRIEQLEKSLDEKKYAAAAKLADSLDWQKIINIKNLNIIARAYRMVEDYEQELEVLKLAYQNSSRGRAILYNLVICSIALENIKLAVEYYNEYVKLFPNNADKLYLKYLLYKLQGASYKDQIGVLEDYCRQDYDERAMFELAYLYHLEGMINQCISKCDDIIMLFHPCEHSYKAMELKMRYKPLNEFQMEKYRQKYNTADEQPPSKDFEPVYKNDGDIVIPEYSPLGETEDKLQLDLSQDIQSIMKGTHKGTHSPTDRSQDGIDVGMQIPGQMSLEEVQFSVSAPTGTVPVPSLINPLPKTNADNSFLSSDALMRARTKELSVKNIVSDERLQKKEQKPPVALSDTQSFDIMKNISQDLAMILGRSADNADNSDNTDNVNNAGNEEISEKSDELLNIADEKVEDEIKAEPVDSILSGDTLEYAAIREAASDADAASDEETVDSHMPQADDIPKEPTVYVDPSWAEQNIDSIDKMLKVGEYGDYAENEELKEPENELSPAHINRLGYFANISGFSKSLINAINMLKSGKKNMAISSMPYDNRLSLAKRLIEAAYRDMGATNIRLVETGGSILNEKDIDQVFRKIAGGFIIIDEASELTVLTVDKICFALRQYDNVGIVLADSVSELKSLFELNPGLESICDIRLHLPILTNNELVRFAEEYAQKLGYSIDEVAKEAILDTISQIQQGEIVVMVNDIQELVNRAINKKESKSFGFFGKSRGDAHILYEKDFLMQK